MDRKEVASLGFEIVSYSGEARSKYIQALNLVKNENKVQEARELIKEATEILYKAHNAQTEMIVKEARGENSELGFIFVHGQDHLMTTMLLKDLMEFLIDIYNK